MERNIERKIIAILNILKDSKEPLGARIISNKLKKQGIELTERAIRYHLLMMDEKRLTERIGRKGRIITPKGIKEISDALVSDKVGMVINKVDTLSYRTTFDIETKKGDVVLNISFIPKEQFDKSLEIMKEVFTANLCITDLVAKAEEGEYLSGIIVPKGKVGFGTVCAVTINGILLHHRIPVYSKFGGILQVDDSDPLRFTEIVSYDGTSLDPAEIFIKSKMTDVLGAARGKQGKILAGFREFPAICLDKVQRILAKLDKIGIGGIIALGKPSQPVLEIPVSTGCVGMVVLGGLNPIAALEETNIGTENMAMSIMMEYAELVRLP
jgi:repressor of nif and glnA expression